MNWTELVGGLGIGSLITSVVSTYMTRRSATSDRWYQEKREAYIGLLDALHNAAIKPSNENSKAYALWQTRCDLFGSKAVSKYAQLIVDTNDGPRENRAKAFEDLVSTMRADLKG